MRYVYRGTGQIFALLPSGQYCFYFISLVCYPSSKQAEAKKKLKTSRHTEAVFVVS